MSRTTLDLDLTVSDELRKRAKRDNKSMGQVASELLSRALAAEEAKPPPFTWISHDLGLPLVDLEDKDAVWAILDERT